MNIVQCASGSSITEMQDILGEYGHKVSTVAGSDTDLILGWSVSMMKETFDAKRNAPHAKLIVYNWDVYEFVWKNPRPDEYDYKLYGELLRTADEVWVPSVCTLDRMREWYGDDIHAKGVVVLSNVPYYDAEVKDDGFALCSMRPLPDRQLGWFERACEELGIRYVSSRHELRLDQYKEMIANCSFFVSPYWEASTGGLSAMEAYYLGKPVLGCKSKYNGLVDYMGDRALYFKAGDYEDLKAQLKFYADAKNRVVASDHKEYIESNFSKDAMSKKMQERIKNLFA